MIRWDDSAVNNLHFPNFCNVAHTERDVTLLFGNGLPAATPGEPMAVQLRERVVLRPLAAKLLATLLARTIHTFEAEHGALGEHFQPLPGSATLHAPEAPLLTVEELSEKGRLLLELIHSLGVPHDTERSIKLLPGKLLANRFLLGLNKDRLTPQAHTRLPVLCKRLGMPAAFISAFNEHLPRANYVHFGYEENEHSSTYKAYVEFIEPFAQALEQRNPDAEPLLLFIGYKWDAADPAKHSITEYRTHPILSPAGIRTKISAILDGPARDIAEGILETVTSRTSKLVYIEASEAANPRQSFDLNAYTARLQLAELYPFLARIAQHYALPAADFGSFYERFKSQTFGHLSGGVDRHGQSFLTLYFGGEKQRS